MTDFLSEVKSKVSIISSLSDEEFIKSLADLEMLVADKVVMLPGHTAKQIDIIRPLRERAKKSRSMKGFAFRRTEKETKDNTQAAKSAPNRLEDQVKSSSSEPVSPSEKQLPTYLSGIEFVGKDVSYERLKDVLIIVEPSLGSLTLLRLSNCKVYCLGSVQSSIVIRDCVGCEIHGRALQVRIHNSRNCTFYVFSVTDPIIENSSELRFGPFSLKGDQVQLEPNSPFQEESANRFSNVRDFNWLKKQPSPNWQLVPATEVHLAEALASEKNKMEE